jgi:hypothetical protein
LLAPRQTPKLEDHPLSAVRDYFFYIFAATLHIGGRSFIRNLRARHAVVTGTHLPHGFQLLHYDIGLTNKLICGVEQGSFILEKLTISCLQNEVTVLRGKIEACEAFHVARTVSQCVA